MNNDEKPSNRVRFNCLSFTRMSREWSWLVCWHRWNVESPVVDVFWTLVSFFAAIVFVLDQRDRYRSRISTHPDPQWTSQRCSVRVLLCTPMISIRLDRLPCVSMWFHSYGQNNYHQDIRTYNHQTMIDRPHYSHRSHSGSSPLVVHNALPPNLLDIDREMSDFSCHCMCLQQMKARERERLRWTFTLTIIPTRMELARSIVQFTECSIHTRWTLTGIAERSSTGIVASTTVLTGLKNVARSCRDVTVWTILVALEHIGGTKEEDFLCPEAWVVSRFSFSVVVHVGKVSTRFNPFPPDSLFHLG